MSTRTWAWVIGLLAMTSASCTKGDDAPPGTVGDAGYGVFQYRCVGPGDAVCGLGAGIDPNEVRVELGIDGQIPALVAVGGRFDLDYLGPEPGGEYGNLPLEIMPARTDVVSSVGGFRFLEAARVAFLARNSQGYTADFIHVTSSVPTSLELWAQQRRTTSVTIAQPEAELIVDAVPVDADLIHLAGALPYQWTSSDELVVRIAEVGTEGIPERGSTTNEDEARLVGIAEGTATVRVEAGELSEEVTVTVGPEVTQ